MKFHRISSVYNATMSLHKTDEPCDCGWLSMAINDSESGIFFDAESNFICLGKRGGSAFIVYHCLLCGGRFPVGEPMWVPIIPDSERHRVENLVSALDSATAILSSLGPPDHDEVVSQAGSQDPKDGVRNIEYYSLSKWFNVEFCIRPDGRVRTELMIKPLSPRPR